MVINSLYAVPGGSLAVRTVLYAGEDDRPKVQISMQNTIRGIP